MPLTEAQQHTIAAIQSPTENGAFSAELYAGRLVLADGTLSTDASHFDATAVNPFDWTREEQQAQFDKAKAAGEIILLSGEGGIEGTLPTRADVAPTPLNTLHDGATGAVVPVSLTEPVAPTPVLPFAVDSAHAIDSLPVGTLATKVSPTAINIDVPAVGVAEHPVVSSDALTHLPVGASVSVISTKTPAPDSQVVGKAVAIALPATASRSTIVIIGSSVHDALARAWHWIKDETLTVEAWAKKTL